MTVFSDISGSHSSDYKIIAVVWDVALCILEQQNSTDISVKPAGSIISESDVCNRFVWNVGTLLPDHMATYPRRQEFSRVCILMVNIFYKAQSWLKIHKSVSFMQCMQNWSYLYIILISQHGNAASVRMCYISGIGNHSLALTSLDFVGCCLANDGPNWA